MFQSTRPVWGATSPPSQATSSFWCFNPRAPCGARRTPQDYQSAVKRFQSTRPVWGATIFLAIIISLLLFQSTRPVWGATPCHRTLRMLHRFQSTRPVWGATHVVSLFLRSLVFQSTRPVWGATHPQGRFCFRGTSFNPRAPCGARRQKRSRLPSSATYLWVFPSTNTIFSAPLRPTPLLRHDSRTYIFTFCFLFTSPSHSVMNAQMMMAASKS